MIDFTGVARAYFERVRIAEERAGADAECSQRRLLRALVEAASGTRWGREHGYGGLRGYEEYASAVPVSAYEDLRPWVERMLKGEKDVLWPGAVKRYAQSSGTSDGRSKYIPLTPRSLERCHYRGAAYSVASYLATHPRSRLFGGKSFILGGSFANELANLPRGVKVGDLSATLIDRINPVVNLLRVPDKRTALLEDWTLKLPRLVEASLRQDIRSISGVPSWFLTVLQQVLQKAGATDIHQVWPQLEVFFHGGISFLPYREQYDAIAKPSKITYWENYNASEGFFAAQGRLLPETGLKPMRLLMNADTFYELRSLRADGSYGEPIPVWEGVKGEVYALIISSSNGLWRYSLGDTIKIENTEPIEITIAGRTRSFINAFGEEVMVHNTERALAAACRECGARVANYTAAPVFAAGGRRGRHQWLVEFATRPSDLRAFAAALDGALQAENSDYAAKRAGGLFLERLEIVEAPPGLFDRWLASTGKLGGQRKVPRLCNDRKLIEAMLKMK